MNLEGIAESEKKVISLKASLGAIALGMAIASCATGRLVDAKSSRGSIGDLQCYCLYGESPAKLEKGIQYGGIDPHAWPGSTDEEKCWSYCQSR